MRPLPPVLACLALTLGLGFAGIGLSETSPVAEIDPPAPGSVTEAEGRAAFDRIHAVTSHPRCANCHVGPDNVPMWYGGAAGPAQPHGMNVNAGESRIGAETLPCTTCHRTSESFESGAHAPPHAGLDWRLPPVEFAWFGKSAAETCAQLSDPDRNGGRDARGLAEHLIEDSGHRGFVLWGWNPGGGREPAPFSLQAHVDDILIWGAAGQPCPSE